MTVRQLLDSADSRELTDWEAYDRLEPFGERMTQLMLAQLTATVVNLVRKKDKKAVKPEDLMPRWVDEGDREPDWKAWKAAMRAITGKGDKKNGS